MKPLADGYAPHSVMIVDDLHANARLVEALLQEDGHTMRIATDGPSALRLIRAAPPDLVLLDVMMPGMDGYEVCQALKRDILTRLIPVVLMTALNDHVSRMRGIEAGADDFISKPFDGAELRARVRSLIRLKRYTDDLDDAEAVIVSLELSIEARDTTTSGHCERLSKYSVAPSIVRHHHERLDGSGYPDRLCGDAIPLLAQIMSIVDVFDALISPRPYKAARSFAAAADELRKEVAQGWRRGDLVDAFLATQKFNDVELGAPPTTN